MGPLKTFEIVAAIRVKSLVDIVMASVVKRFSKYRAISRRVYELSASKKRINEEIRSG